MIPALLILAQASAPATTAEEARYERCVDAATSNPSAGEADALAWRLAGGGYLARQCIGMAYATQARWPAAAQAFEEAARGGAHGVQQAPDRQAQQAV